MNLWRIEYLQGKSIGRTKKVEADLIRVSTHTGDIWFCDTKDKIGAGNYLPKFIVAAGTFLSIERMKLQVTEEEIPDENVNWI